MSFVDTRDCHAFGPVGWQCRRPVGFELTDMSGVDRLSCDRHLKALLIYTLLSGEAYVRQLR